MRHLLLPWRARSFFSVCAAILNCVSSLSTWVRSHRRPNPLLLPAFRCLLLCAPPRPPPVVFACVSVQCSLPVWPSTPHVLVSSSSSWCCCGRRHRPSAAARQQKTKSGEREGRRVEVSERKKESAAQRLTDGHTHTQRQIYTANSKRARTHTHTHRLVENVHRQRHGRYNEAE